MKTLSIRIDDDMRKKLARICEEPGLNATSATVMFYKQLIRERGIPFRPTDDPVTLRRGALAELVERFRSE